MNNKQKQIEKLQSVLPNIELVRCMYGDTDFATYLYDHGCRQIEDNSIVMAKSEKQKLLHEMYEQGRFDAIADLDKNGKVVLLREEYEILKIKEKEKHWLNTCMSVWKNAKIDGCQETAKDILNGLECFFWETAINDTKNFDLYQDLYRSIKEHFKNKYGVIKEN